MKGLPTAVALTGAVLGLVAVTGCSATAKHAEPGGATPSASRKAARPPSAEAVDATPGACPTAASLPLPEDFPKSLPLPHGAVVTSVEHRTGGRLVVATVVRGGFDAALTFLQRQLPKAGYALKEGEAEEDDAESDFTSASVEGRWALRKMPDCEGGVYLTYLTSVVSRQR